jgi:hypothetical protein
MRCTSEALLGYFLRVLGKEPECVSLKALRGCLLNGDLPFKIRADEEQDTNWRRLEIYGAFGRAIAVVECTPVLAESTMPEFAELAGDLASMRPRSAVEWLVRYLSTVRVVYRMEILPAIDELSGWAALHVVQGAIWESAGGILQSDGEGFTNENGYYILWQFREDTAGVSNMAVLDDGDWVEFQMDLGDAEQRAAFLDGRMPEGAEEGALSAP